MGRPVLNKIILTIFSLVFIYYGAVFLIAGVYSYTELLPLYNEKVSQIGMMYSPNYLITILLVGILSPLFGLISLTSGFGTLFYHNWARKLMILSASMRLIYIILAPFYINFNIDKARFYGVEVPFDKVSIFEAGNIIEILILAIIIYSITRPKLKKHFIVYHW